MRRLLVSTVAAVAVLAGAAAGWMLHRVAYVGRLS